MIKRFFGQYITYSKYIFKFWVTQISLSAFGLITVFATVALGGNAAVLGATILSISFFSFLLYDFMYFYGLQVSINPDNRVTFFKNNKGFTVLLLSYLPTFVIISFVITFYFIDSGGSGYVISKAILTLTNGMYNGVWYLLSEYISEPVISVLILLPATLACSLGYYLGSRDLPIRKILGIPIKPPKRK